MTLADTNKKPDGMLEIVETEKDNRPPSWPGRWRWTLSMRRNEPAILVVVGVTVWPKIELLSVYLIIPDKLDSVHPLIAIDWECQERPTRALAR